MTDISVRTAVSERSLLRQLTVIQARRFVRHPLYLAGVALLVVSTVVAIDDAPGDPSTFAGIGWSAAFLLGVFGFVVSYRLTRSDESAVALLPSAPLDPTTRVLALVGACLVPMGTAVVFLLVRLVGYTVWAPYAGLVDAMGGPAVVLVSLLDGAVVACFGGPALGVAAGRWLRFPGAGVIAALLLVLVVAAFSGGANQLSDDTAAGPDDLYQRAATAMPWTTYVIAACNDDPSAPFGCRLHAIRDGSQVGHLAYAMSLSGLAVWAAVMRDAVGATRRRWVRIGAGCAAAALLSLLWAWFG